MAIITIRGSSGSHASSGMDGSSEGQSGGNAGFAAPGGKGYNADFTL